MSACEILTVPQHSHAETKNVLILVIVLQMLTVRLEITEVFAHVDLDTLEIHILKAVD